MLKERITSPILNTLSIIIIITTGCYISLNLYVTNKIGAHLNKEINKASKGAYMVTVSGIHLNVLDLSVEAERIKLIPTLSNKEKITTYSINAKHVRLKAVNLWEGYKNNVLLARALEFENLTISIFKRTVTDKTVILDNDDTLLLHKFTAVLFNRSKINCVSIANTKINVYQAPFYTDELFSFEQSGIRIYNFNVNSPFDQFYKNVLNDNATVKLENVLYPYTSKVIKNKRI